MRNTKKKSIAREVKVGVHGKMDCEVCIMQVSGHPSVTCALHNRWQKH